MNKKKLQEILLREFSQFSRTQKKMFNQVVKPTLKTESDILNYSVLYPTFLDGMEVLKGDFISYGQDINMQRIIYKVLSDTMCSDEYPPTKQIDLYQKIGYTEKDGVEYRVWTEREQGYDKDEVVPYKDENGVVKWYQPYRNKTINPPTHSFSWKEVG